MTEEIMALCRAMGAGEDRGELLLPLVQAAEGSWRARLRKGVRPEDCGPAFPLAVAITAMNWLGEADGSDRVTSFTAGEVSIRTAKTDEGKSLTDWAERLLAPWLGETGFAFRGVRG